MSGQEKLGYGPQALGRSGTPLAAILAACEFSPMAKPKRPKKVSRKAPKSDDLYALRGGEVAVRLPESFDAALYFIGRIRTPWKKRQECPKNARGSDAVCTVELDRRWIEALSGLETASHVVLLYWMDKARRDLAIQSPRHYAERRGTFSIRSPARPNPVAMSVARLVGIDGNKLSVVGVDCLDKTPLIDIKPYFASIDSVPDAVVGRDKRRKS
jgi:tRNA-Thr(GGU) m(6)t(6)A37 methyltransferase TsaA